MTRRRSKQPAKPLAQINQPTNVLQLNQAANYSVNDSNQPKSGLQATLPDSGSRIQDKNAIKSRTDDENSGPAPSTSASHLVASTAGLYDELDSFRQRWKRELEDVKQSIIWPASKALTTKSNIASLPNSSVNNQAGDQDNQPGCSSNIDTDLSDAKKSELLDHTYATAKTLFLTAVALEQDEMHFESIQYYKQAMHLCPDIEKQIFREQCEASAKEALMKQKANKTAEGQTIETGPTTAADSADRNTPLYDRIRDKHLETNTLDAGCIALCSPNSKVKSGVLHVSDLPYEMVLKIARYVIGDVLDLASLESLGLVSRGFYLLSRDPSLWRSICYSTWRNNTILEPNDNNVEEDENTLNEKTLSEYRNEVSGSIDWRLMFSARPRVNFDGVYISRTRYIRQGDVGFQDITYRPFHVIRYYRYLRFFPDRRVLILTTNEEPDKIIPIFRHALRPQQFSPELSILEGSYEFHGIRLISITAERDFRTSIHLSHNIRRRVPFHWSRQTPLSQRFNLKFKLTTAENKPYKNNVLKWQDYSILSRNENGQDLTSFDLNSDNFPSLVFSRVKRFNLRVDAPLSNY